VQRVLATDDGFPARILTPALAHIRPAQLIKEPHPHRRIGGRIALRFEPVGVTKSAMRLGNLGILTPHSRSATLGMKFYHGGLSYLARGLWPTDCGCFTTPLGALASSGHHKWKMIPSVWAAASAVFLASSGD
jgi:hypothetical protein